MSAVLTMAEIEAIFDSEWVLIETQRRTKRSKFEAVPCAGTRKIVKKLIDMPSRSIRNGSR